MTKKKERDALVEAIRAASAEDIASVVREKTLRPREFATDLLWQTYVRLSEAFRASVVTCHLHIWGPEGLDQSDGGAAVKEGAPIACPAWPDCAQCRGLRKESDRVQRRMNRAHRLWEASWKERKARREVA